MSEQEVRARALVIGDIGDKTAAERVLQQVRYSSGRDALHDEPFPSVRQIACVMHALADYTHNEHMVGREVYALGGKAPVLNQQATGLGRYFHAVGDQLEDIAWAMEQEAQQ